MKDIHVIRPMESDPEAATATSTVGVAVVTSSAGRVTIGDMVVVHGRPTRGHAALTGTVAAGVALAAGEVVAAMLGTRPSPVLAVGGRFVDRFAATLKDVAVAIFGTNDKAALVVGTVVVTLALGAATGLLARRFPLAPIVVFIVFGAFGAWAEAADPQVQARPTIVVAVAAVGAGLVTFAGLWRLAPSDTASEAATIAVAEDPRVKPTPVASRRRFLAASGAVAAAAAGFAAAGRALAHGDVIAAVKAIPLPRPRRRVAVPDDTAFRAKGATPYVTPTEDFYRIDTALSAPRVDATSWRLEVSGLVDHPFSMGYEELLSLPSVEEPVTLSCVSNEVGGDLVGNAVWQGVPLAALLERAGVRRGAEQVFSRSVDGWTCGFPLGALDSNRTALVAYAMNGRKLPVEHGFPARLVVAGLYGYVSATKWLRSIELTTWDGADGYWVPRGWSKEGPIKLSSRIDVPRDDSEVPAGPTTIAGVAWRPSVGVSAVEVSVDHGPWTRCELGSVAGDDTWVQWRHRWQATPGDHEVRVRAVDGDQRPQVTAVAAPAPDGATGLHQVRFRVSG